MESNFKRVYRDEVTNQLKEDYEDIEVTTRTEEVSAEKEETYRRQLEGYLNRTEARKNQRKSLEEQIDEIDSTQEEDDDEYSHLVALFNYDLDEDEEDSEE